MPTRAFIALLILPVLAGLLQFGPYAGSQELSAGASGTIHADVLRALQTETEVGVIISLKGAGMAPEDATRVDLVDNTATRQADVLAALAQGDFSRGDQYEVVAALAGASNNTRN